MDNQADTNIAAEKKNVAPARPVAVIKETRQSAFIRRIMDLIAPHISLKSSDKVAIKINLSGSREIYANTHYETVAALIQYLQENLAIKDITVVEGSDGAYFSGKTTWDIFYKFRYKEVELMGAKLANLDELPHNRMLTVKTLRGNQEISLAEFPCDYLISLIPPKTHNILPVFLSIPNLIGFVKAEQRVFMFGAGSAEMKKINYFQNEKYFDLIHCTNRNFVELAKLISPSLTLIDGIYGMEGKGPIKGSPVFHGFSVASEDAFLADAMTAHIMGFPPGEIPYLVMAEEDGLGRISLSPSIGVDPNYARFPYRPHPLYHRQKKWRR